MKNLIRELMILNEVQVIVAQKLNHDIFNEVSIRIEEIKSLILEEIEDSINESNH